MDRRLGKLNERADALAERAERLVASALRSLRGEMSLLADELNLAGSAKDRDAAEAEIRRRLAKLSNRLDSLLSAQTELAAKSAVADAADLTGVKVGYSRQRAEAVCRLASPAQGDSLAAVLTDRMAQSLVNALRNATVAALRRNAVEGGSLRDLSHDILERWKSAAGEKPLFTDSAGRTWDTARYVQMNARTNSMRVYNDCLADALARSGSDLARVSRGGNPTCDGCFPWEGAILSLSGSTKGFPTYEQARASGCFHPNCTHTLDPVDETADADEIELQRDHPPGEPDGDGAFPFDDADERRWEIDVDRKMRGDPSLSRADAETAVNRDNLAANIRAGLVRADAPRLVAQLTDAQVNALCPDGNPPKFAPVKRVRGGTRSNPKYEPERRRSGSRGGSIRIARDTSAEHLLQVANLDRADGNPAPKPGGWSPKSDLEKATDALMRSIGATHTDAPLGIGGTNPNYSKGRQWRVNCQRCVPAYEARCRGYDVTAKPCDGNYDVSRFFKGGIDSRIRCRGGSGFRTDVEEIVSNAPEGSRFIVRIKWPGGKKSGAHFFSARNENGKAVYENPQNPPADTSAFFLSAGRKGNWIMRIDNREFSNEIADAVIAARTESGQGSQTT